MARGHGASVRASGSAALSIDSERSAFAVSLEAIHREFGAQESRLRGEYARNPEASIPLSDLLERPTRRFLVDRLLEALDWDAGDSDAVIEEARAKGRAGNWLFFDYLGIRPDTRAPVLLVEAKRHDLAPPHRGRSGTPSPEEMARILVEAIDAMHREARIDAIVSEWADYLRDLRNYVRSLEADGCTTLCRVVITAGRWMVVFTNPVATFGRQGRPEIAHVHCFANMQEMLAGAGRLFDLLHRSILVDTLPLALSIEEALAFLKPGTIEASFRAVVVATSGTSGALRDRYPTRTTYPAQIVRSGGRLFAVVDYQARTPEPEGLVGFDGFLRRIALSCIQLEGRLQKRLGRFPDSAPVSEFEGFMTRATGTRTMLGSRPPTDSRHSAGALSTRRFVIDCHGEGTPNEFVIVTGLEHFYKAPEPSDTDCEFHSWLAARNAGAPAGPSAQEDVHSFSFTVDGDANHCAHGDMVAMRSSRCRIDAIEQRMCCRACLYESECWTEEEEVLRLPCPAPRKAASEGA